MPEEYEERIKFEDPPENPIPFHTIWSETYIATKVTNGKITANEKIGLRYATVATKKIGNDIEDWITSKRKKK